VRQKPAELFIWFLSEVPNYYRTSRLNPLSMVVQTTTRNWDKIGLSPSFVLVSAHSPTNNWISHESRSFPFLQARFEEIFDERNEFDAATVEDYPPPAA